MTERKPMKRGQGKRQFFACLDRINELVEKGYDSPLLIHETLVNEGRITMTYANFYNHFTQRKRKDKLKKLGMPVVSCPPASTVPAATRQAAPAAPVPSPTPGVAVDVSSLLQKNLKSQESLFSSSNSDLVPEGDKSEFERDRDRFIHGKK